MKKLNYLILGLAGLTLASCSNEEGLQAPNDGTYQITVNLPKDMATRAIGDEITCAQTLNYTLFEVNGETNTPVESKTIPFANGATSMQLDLPLVKGQNYKIAFFSQSTSSTSAYKYESGIVTVDYTAMTYTADTNADEYDCFFGNLDLGTVEGAISTSVTLTRPVAQINWGTNDLTSAAVTSIYGENAANIETTLEMTAFNTLNTLTGEISEANTSFATNALTNTTETYPVSGNYKYLAMQYVLAPNNGKSANYDLKLKVTNKANAAAEPIVIEVSNAPLQANYRTNIYGALLTNQASLDVNLSSNWDGQNNIPLIWDGKTVTTPEINTEENTVTINGVSDLAGLANIVNGETTIDGVPSSLEGYTITLSADYDLAGNSLSIGTATRASSSTTDDTKSFKGTFDGNGKTISGLTISYDGSDANAVAAFIPNLDGEGKVQDVTFENVYIDGGACEQAGIIGLVTNGATVSNVNVTGGHFSSAEVAGAIVGRMMKYGTITGCNNGATVTGVKNVGGIVGAAYYTEMENVMVIANCTNTGNISGSATGIGGIAGMSAADISGCINKGAISSPNGTIGGIVGYQVEAGFIKDCTNEATGTVTATGPYAGGMVGRIAYGLGTSTYPRSTTIEMSGNKNYANISSSTETGGMVGRWDGIGICINNNNYAKSLVATGSSNAYVAGIVGSVLGGKLQVSGNQSTTTEEQMVGKQVNLLFNGATLEYTGSN